MRKETSYPGEKFNDELASICQPEDQETARSDAPNPLVEHPEMYRLFNDPPLRERDIQRYLSSNQELTKQLPEIIEHDGLDSILRWDNTDLVTQAPEEKRTEIIERYLTHPMPLIRRHALRLIKYAPQADREYIQNQATAIINESLDDPDSEGRIFAVDFIDQVSIKDQPHLRRRVEELINLDLTSENFNVHNRAIKLIKYASPEQQDSLRRRAVNIIKRDLTQGSSHIQERAARLIEEALPEDQPHLRKKITAISENYLNHEKRSERMKAAGFINHASPDDQLRLIKLLLADEDPLIRSSVFRAVDLNRLTDPESQKDIIDLVERGLNDPELLVRKCAVRSIITLPASERTRLIKRCLIEDDLGTKLSAGRLIPSAPEQDRAPLIRECLARNNNSILRLGVVDFISWVPSEERAQLFEQCLTDDNPEIRQAVKTLVRPDELPQLLAHQPNALDKIKDLAEKTPLYKNQPAKFGRIKFDKTGSDTILLDEVPGQPENSFRDRVIIRQIDTASYLSWRKAFEAADFWKSKGFDYVPIEPIIKVAIAEDVEGEVTVITRVIKGPSIDAWNAEEGLYPLEIDRLKEKIVAGLEELGIEHGHLHDGNFVVLFERDADGEAKLDQFPRLYAIDFDQAVSTL